MIVDLKGNPIDAAPDTDRALATLKKIVAEIEAGEIHLEKVYVLADATNPNDRSVTTRVSRDSGITLAEAALMLEFEKAVLMRMAMRGVD